MIVLSGITMQSNIYESSASLVYRGFREEDGQEIVIKLFKENYPSLQELTRYRQEYKITFLIAATAIVKGLIVVSNDSDLARVEGLSLENWLEV